MRISDWSSDVCSSDLKADRRISAVGTRPEILPDARLRVEIGSNGAAVEDLRLDGFDALVKDGLAFALEREPVDVAAIPSFAFPAKTVATLARLLLGTVEADEADTLPAQIGKTSCRERVCK